MGWDEASKYAIQGLALGMQIPERKQRMGLREEAAKREETRFKWAEKEHEKKKNFEIVKREVATAKAMMDAGQDRMAAKKIVDLYNEQYPDGGEARIIFKSDNPGSNVWQDPKLKDKDVALLTKKWGILPANNMKDIMSIVASSLNFEQFSKDIEGVKAKIAEANAASKPFPGADGKMYVQKYKEGPGGSIVKAGDPVPYVGPAPAEGGLKKAYQAGLKPPQLGTEEREILADIREKKKEPKAGDLAKQRKALTEEMAKDLKLVLTPFAKPGKTLIDPETFEITSAGKGAMDAAIDLYQKYKDKKELTAQERKKLKYARDVWKMYQKMADLTSSKYIKPGEANQKGWKKYQKGSSAEGSW